MNFLKFDVEKVFQYSLFIKILLTIKPIINLIQVRRCHRRFIVPISYLFVTVELLLYKNVYSFSTD